MKVPYTRQQLTEIVYDENSKLSISSFCYGEAVRPPVCHERMQNGYCYTAVVNDLFESSF